MPTPSQTLQGPGEGAHSRPYSSVSPPDLRFAIQGVVSSSVLPEFNLPASGAWPLPGPSRYPLRIPTFSAPWSFPNIQRVSMCILGFKDWALAFPTHSPTLATKTES